MSHILVLATQAVDSDIASMLLMVLFMSSFNYKSDH